MSEIFDEARMRWVLGDYIPEGEELAAGIHAISQETHIKGIFGKCIYMEDKLIPDEKGRIITLDKKKCSSYDVYIGITRNVLVIAGCERNSYLYELDDAPDGSENDMQKITSEVLLADIGTCYPLTDGSSFKLVLPKLGGVGGGMPHHAEYREAIIKRLGGI